MPSQTPASHVVNIRQAGAKDAGAVDKMAYAEFGAWWRSFYSTRAALTSSIRTSRRIYLVAEASDGRVVGFTMSKPSASATCRDMLGTIWAELAFIKVENTFRGAGIGSKLVTAIRQAALLQGYLGMMASVRPETIPFWASVGWGASNPGDILHVPDPHTGDRYGSVAWINKADREYPVWVWVCLDPARPVKAFLYPANHPPLLAELRKEVETVGSYAL